MRRIIYCIPVFIAFLMLFTVVTAQADIWYRDLDGDLWGDCSDRVEAPYQPPGYVAMCGDCDDLNDEVNPGMFDIIGNDIDEDCDNYYACYEDADDDGYGSNQYKSSPFPCSMRNNGQSDVNNDCDDTAPWIHPGAVEICNEVDDNCNDIIDEGCEVPAKITTWSCIKALYQ